VQALESSVKTSQGAATLHDAHWTSNSGRKVPYVVIGTGPTAVMIVAQQHGDEMETSDSAVNLVRTLSNNSMESKTIRAALTVVVVPRVNVDGFDGKKADGTPLTNATGTQIWPGGSSS
jgi:predicted deacylase